MNTLKTILSALVIAVSTVSYAFADVVVFKDDTLVTCKIIGRTEDGFMFANYEGTFRVKEYNVKKVYVTRSVDDDIVIYRRFGKTVNEQEIRRHFLAGTAIKKSRDEKAADQRYRDRQKRLATAGKSSHSSRGRQYNKRHLWDYGRISLAASFYGTVSLPGLQLRANEIVPMGTGFHLAYDQGMEFNVRKRKKWMPGLRIELGFLYMAKTVFIDNSREVFGATGQAGPMWAFPYLEHRRGCAVLAVMPGMSFLYIINRDNNSERMHFSPSLTGLVGYEYSFHDIVSFFFHVRYTYIHDPGVAFHSIGAVTGFAFRLN